MDAARSMATSQLHGYIVLAVANNKLRRLSWNIVSAVDNGQLPYTHVNIVTVGENQIAISTSSASGKGLLLKMARSMMDPAWLMRC